MGIDASGCVNTGTDASSVNPTFTFLEISVHIHCLPSLVNHYGYALSVGGLMAESGRFAIHRHSRKYSMKG